MKQLLNELCRIPAVSGAEDTIREYIKKRVGAYCECSTDRSGNLICLKKGKNPAKYKVMVDAHMDEVGIIAREFTAEGFIKFDTVGGIDTSVMLARRVVFENGAVGVVGVKPTHLCSADEKKKYPEKGSLYIDIGATDKQSAQKLVSYGEVAVFESEPAFSGNLVKARALDDRIGVAALIKLLEKKSEYDFCAVFSVSEEIGCRGAKTAAFSLEPDFAVVLEATSACDLHGVAEENRVCVLGDGPAVSFMDKATLYEKRLYDLAINSGLKCQTKKFVSGGNDAGAIHLTKSGVPTVTLSAPCRYIHSPSPVANLDDAENMVPLAEHLINTLASGEEF